MIAADLTCSKQQYHLGYLGSQHAMCKWLIQHVYTASICVRSFIRLFLVHYKPLPLPPGTFISQTHHSSPIQVVPGQPVPMHMNWFDAPLTCNALSWMQDDMK